MTSSNSEYAVTRTGDATPSWEGRVSPEYGLEFVCPMAKKFLVRDERSAATGNGDATLSWEGRTNPEYGLEFVCPMERKLLFPCLRDWTGKREAIPRGYTRSAPRVANSSDRGFLSSISDVRSAAAAWGIRPGVGGSFA